MARRTRAGTINSGLGLLGIGVAVTLGSLAIGGSVYVLAAGPILFGSVRLVQGLRMPPEDPIGLLRDAGAGDDGPSLTGRLCASCRRTIREADDATVCGRCAEPVHDACLRAHRLAHRKARAQSPG